MSKIKFVPWLAATCLFASSGLLAQTGVDHLRERVSWKPVNLKWSGGYYSVRLDEAKVVLEGDDGAHLDSETMSWGVAGHVARSSDSTFVASGLSIDPSTGVRSGHLTHWSLTDDGSGVPELTLGQEVVYPGVDPIAISVLHREDIGQGGGGLFVVDAVGDRLLWVPVDASGFPALSGIGVVADSSTIPELAEAGLATKAMVSGLAPGIGARVSFTSKLGTSYDVVESGASTWSVALASGATTGPVLQDPLVFVSTLVPGQYYVPSTLAAGTLSLLDPDNSVLQTWNPTLDQWSAFPSEAEFDEKPGHRFSLRHDPTGLTSFVYPAVRHGTPWSGSSSFSVGRGEMPMLAWVGNDDFGHGVAVSTTVSGAIQGVLHIAFRDPAGSDPVVNGILTPAAAVQFSIDGLVCGDSLGLSVPISSDPGQVGLVALFQYLFVLPDLTLAWSDVFGTTIRENLAGGGAAQSLSGGGGDGQGPSVAIREACLNDMISEAVQRNRAVRMRPEAMRRSWQRFRQAADSL